jgi:hypothetical protein
VSDVAAVFRTWLRSLSDALIAPRGQLAFRRWAMARRVAALSFLFQLAATAEERAVWPTVVTQPAAWLGASRLLQQAGQVRHSSRRRTAGSLATRPASARQADVEGPPSRFSFFCEGWGAPVALSLSHTLSRAVFRTGHAKLHHVL